jgi:replicative DNA helicase
MSDNAKIRSGQRVAAQDVNANLFNVLPPQSIEAEKAMLSSILLDNSQVNSAVQIVAPDDFYDIVNSKIYKAITILTEKNVPIDIITIKNILEHGQDGRASLNGLTGDISNAQAYDGFNWGTYLVNLMDMPAGLSNVEQYARIVKEKSILRHLINAVSKVQHKCYDQREPLEDVLDFTEKTIFDVTEKNTSKTYYEIYPLMLDYFKKLTSKTDSGQDITGVHSGFKYLDELTNGFQLSDFIIIAGRPSMGKTALALTIAKNIAIQNIPVAFFSLEMSKEQLVTRLISMTARIDSAILRKGKIHDPDIDNLINAMHSLENIPIYIDDSAGISAMEIRAKTRRLKIEKNIGVVIIDYLQLMKSSIYIESREQAIADISRSIKSLAKELKIPIIALSQLNRLVESRSDKRPQLADLRESGAIEQDADLIMFVYREEVYKKDTENKGIAELIIGKQRNGPTGVVKLSYIDRFTSFENLAQNYEDTEGF